MEIINFTSLKKALEYSIKLLPNQKDLNICLTGGSFGSCLTRKFVEENLDISSWNIFLTDERLNCTEDDQIRVSLQKYLCKLRGFCSDRYHPFEQKNFDESYINLVQIPLPSRFDLTFLSLGEDGHLAGHFENSLLANDRRFCYTENAIKIPKERISFTIQWLMRSKKVILAIFGREKNEALLNLINNKGLHSSITEYSNLTVLTDIKI